MARLELLLEAPTLPRVTQRLAGIDVGRLLAVAIRQWAKGGLRRLEQATPERTGTMKRSWQPDIRPTQASLTNPVPYAKYVLEGTPAHEIQGHPFLAFIGGEGKVVTRVVDHPGTKGNLELNRAIEALVRGATDVGTEVATQVAEEVHRG